MNNIKGAHDLRKENTSFEQEALEK